jgi:succinyl-CoA synthetase alpha subunit
MPILINEETRVLVQGITGKQGSIHTEKMLKYGTKIVAGVTPGKGGLKIHGVPVYNKIEEAIKYNRIDATIVFVPANNVFNAVKEAIENNIKIIIVITELTPLHDSLQMIELARNKGVRIIGPNSAGIIVPNKVKIGIMPHHVFSYGKVGIMSRSGTLTYEIANILTKNGIGQSTSISVGGDRVVGTTFLEVYKMFEEDKETESIIIIGEIGGTMEEELSKYLMKNGIKKNTIAYIVGKTAPPEKRMGHAGAIVIGEIGSYKSKVESLMRAGVRIAMKPYDIIKFL